MEPRWQHIKNGELAVGVSETHIVPCEKAISLCSTCMTGEMVVTSTGQMTCFTWMCSTEDSQADESRHVLSMSTDSSGLTRSAELQQRDRSKVINTYKLSKKKDKVAFNKETIYQTQHQTSTF